ncbi:hypothetical protein PCASD_15060 [Puccinia coronata f. sp. avenae]|uniref:CxC1-like cysteine cluster associated with KDZ transposases domain-containing protein n=1 Tax=Puccinia coronata f. sp. avenae TaxID=200324 RepID=A0A2N5UAU9_9BASI|nr:hypothetical protein PCASD_15060 [Puccinia coronata f. sp. avenae]
MPQSVQILTTGFLSSSPISPSTAFLVRLLAYHNYAWHHSNVRTFPFALTQQIFSEEQSEILWNKRKKVGHNLTNFMSSAVWVYCNLLNKTDELVQSTLCLTEIKKLAAGSCPACFGTSMNTGLHQLASVDNCLIISVDGNFQHRHQKVSGRNQLPLVTPSIFVDLAKLDAVKEYIRDQEKIHKIPKKELDQLISKIKSVIESLTSIVVGAIDDALEALNLENDREEQAQEEEDDDWLDDDKHQAEEVNANESTNANADESTNENAD